MTFENVTMGLATTFSLGLFGAGIIIVLWLISDEIYNRFMNMLKPTKKLKPSYSFGADNSDFKSAPFSRQ